MIEQSIEAKIKTALEALGLGVTIVPTWLPSAEGEVMGDEGTASAVIATSVSSPSFDAWLQPLCEIECSMVLSVALGSDANGSLRASLWAKVSALLRAWQASCAAFKAAFATDDFIPAGFELTTGGTPSVVAESGVWTCSASFRLRGAVADTSVNS